MELPVRLGSLQYTQVYKSILPVRLVNLPIEQALRDTAS